MRRNWKGNDADNGSAPDAAFAAIQKGIDCAENGDTVLVPHSEYTGTANRDILCKGLPKLA